MMKSATLAVNLPMRRWSGRAIRTRFGQPTIPARMARRMCFRVAAFRHREKRRKRSTAFLADVTDRCTQQV
jgi:hypothetical protein